MLRADRGIVVARIGDHDHPWPRGELLALELSGDVNNEGQLEGDAVLLFPVDEELIRARCTLGPADYLKAHDAHGRQRYVSVHGKLIHAGRKYTLVETKDLKIID